jgi:hypothetical protein
MKRRTSPLKWTALLLAAAWTARLVSDRAFPAESDPVPLRRPLAEFSRDLLGSGWTEEDVALEPATLRVARVSDYLLRRYTKGSRTVWLYIGYVDHWRPEAIHHPRVCFPAAGQELAAEEEVSFPVDGLDALPEFREIQWVDGGDRSTFTLYSFAYNGRFDPRETRLRLGPAVGIRSFAVVTLSGDPVTAAPDHAQSPSSKGDSSNGIYQDGSVEEKGGSIENTRRFYYNSLRRVLPELTAHLPGAHD